jgi:hypothetical protein
VGELGSNFIGNKFRPTSHNEHCGPEKRVNRGRRIGMSGGRTQWDRGKSKPGQVADRQL